MSELLTLYCIFSTLPLLFLALFSMSKLTRWFVGFAAIVAVVALGWYGMRNTSVQPQEQTLAPITIGYREHDLYAPLFVGMEKGFFTDAGLTVKTVKFESTNDLINAVLAHQVDAALGGVNVPSLLTIENKSPGSIKIFGTARETADKPSAFLIVRADDPITSIRELGGKKIGAFQGSLIKLLYKKIFDGKISDTTLVQMDQKLLLTALESKQIDAALVLEPLAAVGSAKKISRPLETALFHTYLLNDLPISASIISSQFATEQTGATERLVEAADKTVDFMSRKPDELKTILVKFTPVDLETAKHIVTPPFQKSTELPVEKLQELADTLLADGELKTGVDVKKMVLDTAF